MADLFGKNDIYDLGLDPLLNRQAGLPSGSVPLDIVPSIPDSPATGSPVTTSVQSERVISGSFADILFANKATFTDTANGYRMGIDPVDHVFKWFIGNTLASVDFGVTNPNVLTFNVTGNPATSNAIFIQDDSPSAWPAVDIRRTTGTGSGIYIQNDSPTGYSLDILNASDTPAVHVISSGSGSSVVPLQLQRNNATSTNFYEEIELRGSAVPAVSVSIWAANNTTPNGTLTAGKGDICLSSNGNLYVNTDGGTTWAALSQLTTPVSVANGGTGDTSLTAYAVLCGGTTSTNPVQSVASVGSSGQILTSNGAGTLPTFQSLPNASPSFRQAYLSKTVLANMAVSSAYNSASVVILTDGADGIVGGSTFNVYRYVKDSSGQFYFTHTITTTTKVQNTYHGVWPVVIGSYVYLPFLDSTGTFYVERRDLADLTNPTSMTISGTAPVGTALRNPSFTDGTDLYIARGNLTSSKDYYRFTISGTTITNAATKTYGTNFTPASIPSLWSDGTSVWAYGNDTGAGTAWAWQQCTVSSGTTVATSSARKYGYGASTQSGSLTDANGINYVIGAIYGDGSTYVFGCSAHEKHSNSALLSVNVDIFPTALS